jgi:hypothetical protein
MTKVEVLLSVAAKLPQPFTVNDLAVAAFKQSPTLFALRGFPKYLDNNKVLSVLSGQGGMLKKGLLEKVRPGVYKLPIRSIMET